MPKLDFEIETDVMFSLDDFEQITKMFFSIESFKTLVIRENGEWLFEMTFDRERAKGGKTT